LVSLVNEIDQINQKNKINGSVDGSYNQSRRHFQNLSIGLVGKETEVGSEGSGPSD
jgi:hypothetical protein